ncbi:tetratricopeptide repeat protein [Horticoccus sp. 23ND18S-11]|uniref:tetratricopeptide repeat protein n=1 Tax=Horticoccus sp. 23ND18S-11 TaxID=3391832 RepID=UPI0039C96F1E
MSMHLERARLLLAQSRPEDAERESMLALSQQPDDPQALALLALSRLEQGKKEPALEAARNAVGLAPDEPFYHSVHAHVLRELERPDEAFRAVQEALRLDPADANQFSLLASIELYRHRWPAALEAAEMALALNPEHVGAANLRAMALVRLGRKAEAMQSVDYALDRAPEDAFSHANQGWNLLHRNEPARAQEHFREALRLDPELDYAREGMLEALKARNPVYRGMLAYFLWLGRQSTRFQWAFIIGIFFGSRLARSLSESQPELNWLWWPLLGLFYLFVYLSWTAQPMFNLLLRFDRFGRHVLSADQRTASTWFGAVFVAAVGCVGWWLIGKNEAGFLGAVILAVLSVCVAATFTRRGRSRLILAATTAALGIVATVGAVLIVADNSLGLRFITMFTLGFIGFQLLANSLSGK